MRCVLLIALREFTENVRTKGFWLGLLLFPTLIVLGGTLPMLLTRKATPTRTYVLVDLAGDYAGLVRDGLAQDEADRVASAREDWERRNRGASNAPAFTPPRPRFQEVDPPSAVAGETDPGRVEGILRPLLDGRDDDSGLFAAIVIPPGFGPGSTNELRYWCANQADTGLRQAVEQVLRSEFRRREYRRLGLDPEVVRRVERLGLPVSVLNPRKAVGEERVGMSDTLRQWAPSLFVYLLWVGIFAISQMLLTGVIEEKGNRVIEVLLSSVTPGELMMGKLAGIAAVGLVMVSAWLGSLVGVALWQAGAGAGSAGPAGSLTRDIVNLLDSTPLLPGFIGYFLLGYLLYAAVFLTAGSLCNTLKEAQNLMAPLMLILMVPLFLMPFIPRDPNGPLATALSWVPWYTPFVMLNRLGADPPMRDVVGTLVLLLVFTAGVLWACGRIFRHSILRTGQPPRWLELWRWLRGRV